MNVHDLLELEGMKAVEDRYELSARENDPQGRDWDEFLEKMGGFVRTLLAIRPEAGEDDYVFLHLPSMIENGIQFEAECTTKENLEQSLQKIANTEVIPGIDTDQASLQELKAYLTATEGLVPECYACEFTPWEQLLAAEVYPQNYILGVVDDPDYNKMSFILSILWDMSFNGLTTGEQQKERDDLERSLQELDELRQLPEEEQEKYVHDLVELDTDFENCEPTEDETLQNYRGFAVTRQERIRVLKALRDARA